MPLIIGVTGSIASGKSLVCTTLQELGAAYCDADKLVHRLYDPGTPGFDRVVAAFGRDIVGPDGYIDRRILGSKVFGKPEEMRRLTQAIGNIGEAVKEVIDGWRASLGPEGAAVIEAVNLIEAGYAAWCDQTWLVVCGPDEARRRLMARNGFTEEEANQRLASQRDPSLREPAADFVLRNEGDPAAAVQAVRQEFQRVYALYREGALPPSRFHAWWEAVRARRAGQGASS